MHHSNRNLLNQLTCTESVCFEDEEKIVTLEIRTKLNFNNEMKLENERKNETS